MRRRRAGSSIHSRMTRRRLRVDCRRSVAGGCIARGQVLGLRGRRGTQRWVDGRRPEEDGSHRESRGDTGRTGKSGQRFNLGQLSPHALILGRSNPERQRQAVRVFSRLFPHFGTAAVGEPRRTTHRRIKKIKKIFPGLQQGSEKQQSLEIVLTIDCERSLA